VSALPTAAPTRSTRERLVDAAGARIARDGYDAVSLRDVAADAGMTTGAIYGHFRNKADLLAAVVAERIGTDLVAPSIGLGADLPGTLAWQAERAADRAGLRALLVDGAHAARTDADAGRLIGAVLQDRLAEWGAQYRAVQAAGGYDDVDMDALLTLLLAVELGLGVLEATGVALPDPATWSVTVRQVVEGVASPPLPTGQSTPEETPRSAH